LAIRIYKWTEFLTACRQEVTRSHQGWALDNVAMIVAEVTKIESRKALLKEYIFMACSLMDVVGARKKANVLKHPLKFCTFQFRVCW
jgi:hypothetical protein